MAGAFNAGTGGPWPVRISFDPYKRIADLERQLAEAKAGWDSCIADLKKAASICMESEAQLAEAKKAAEWTLIDTEHFPNIGDELLDVRTLNISSMPERMSMRTLGRFTHYRPITAPTEAA